MELKIQRAIVFVRDMAVMTRFYSEVLGLPRSAEAESMADWQVFSAGGMELALHAIPKEFAEGIVIDDPPEPRTGASVATFSTRQNQIEPAIAIKVGRLQIICLLLVRGVDVVCGE